jgi:hypothetical protein
MTDLHLFLPRASTIEFERPSMADPSYAEGERSEVNGVTQSRRRRNSLRALSRDRGFLLTNACVMFNRVRERRTVK